ncbi:hypothetical protein [Homoserinibacter sp. YIM 151385]|uniref:hypothetical protein n=1 Tax=Homoserinibacter sp. YIM 151385 TaxID=2985506 RepID=UPI0022F0C648|nr:hypothetical protein [Homoserinibacter sp. YIM 151385]WBU38198.1 hypothetical protein OF852_01040 [Homoserinibacter sp. YIM 151385]
MEAREAAELLGVGLDAGRPEIDRAFQRLAREAHPDRHPDDAPEALAAANAGFARLIEARDAMHRQALLRERWEAGGGGRPPTTADASARARNALPPPRPAVLALWVALLGAALALAAWGAPHPLGPVEPVARTAAALLGLAAFAVTGRSGWMWLGLAGVLATALMAALFTTIAALLGTLLAVAPTIALVVAGRRRA